MKKALVTLLTLFALLCVCAFSFASCDDEGNKTDTTIHEHLWSDWTTVTPATCIEGKQERVCACGEKEFQSVAANTEHTYDENGSCTICNDQLFPYTLTYTSNGDGTCYVSKITTYDAYQEDFALEIPERSPAGDRVTAVRCPDFATIREIPYFFAAEDMEAIFATIKAKVNAGELDEFYYKKFNTYFQKKTLSDMKNDNAKKNLLATYPICAVTDIYVYASFTSPNEDQWVLNYLQAYCDYSNEKLASYYQHLHDIVNESTVENKAEILASLPAVPTAFDDHVISIRVPSNLEEIPLSLYISCNNLKELILPACITEIPDSAFADTLLTSITLPDTLRVIGNDAFLNCPIIQITIPSSVTTIGSNAFFGTAITSVTIPSSVITIGNRAFSGTAITNVIISSGVKAIGSGAFSGTAITNVAIPSGVKMIGNGAFSNCKELTTVTLGEGIDEISDSLFENCGNLTKITLPQGVTVIGQRAFANCSSLKDITIPQSVTNIETSAFEECSSLTSVSLSNGVEEIQRSAFAGCSNLESITLPDSVTFIGAAAFDRCNKVFQIDNGMIYIDNWVIGVVIDIVNLTLRDNTVGIANEAFRDQYSMETAIIPNSVKYIGDSAFYYCRALRDITLSNNLKTIGRGMFYGCTSLVSVSIPNGITSISPVTFSGCTNLTSVSLPDSVTEIGSLCFEGCINLVNLSIPSSVTKIDDAAFMDCTNLFHITLPSGITEISSELFLNCSNITQIMIPNGVTTIDFWAFESCTKLTALTLPATVKFILENAFNKCTSLTAIYYDGTELEWDSISISSGNAPLTGATLYFYSENPPTNSGNYWHYVDGVPEVWETDTAQ